MSIIELWPIASFSAVIVFSLGVVVERYRNGKYVQKAVCREVRQSMEVRLDDIKVSLGRIEGRLYGKEKED